MTDKEFLDKVATNPIVNKDPDSIEQEVTELKSLGLATIQRAVPWYWRKNNSSFTLSVGDNLADLADEFSDFYIPLFFWTTSGALKPWTEKQFRSAYPNPTETGNPDKYIPLTKNEYLFHPTPEVSTTVYVSYLFKPTYSSIEEIPEEFHDVLLYYVLMSYEKPTSEGGMGKYAKLYFDGLSAMKNDGKPSDEWQPEVVLDVMVGDVESARSSLTR